LSTKNPEKNTK